MKDILDHLLSFYPPNKLKNQKFEKIKTTLRFIIILQMCTINDDHMMYGFWDMECDGQTFLSFWAMLCPFNPLTTWKIEILKKFKKTHGDIIILHMRTINGNHMMYGSWNMECNRHKFLSFWTSFYPFTPLKTQENQNFFK